MAPIIMTGSPRRCHGQGIRGHGVVQSDGRYRPERKGRIFHTTEGHDVPAMNSPDFVLLLQRGTEWAATGKVTQKVPKTFGQ
jgi:type 1 glutamine amidotransferase